MNFIDFNIVKLIESRYLPDCCSEQVLPYTVVDSGGVVKKSNGF